MTLRSTYTAHDVRVAIQREADEGIYTFSDCTIRCSVCREPVDLLVSELNADGSLPSGYKCATCDDGINYDPREPETRR